jgi:hypothetical protein
LPNATAIFGEDFIEEEGVVVRYDVAEDFLAGSPLLSSLEQFLD